MIPGFDPKVMLAGDMKEPRGEVIFTTYSTDPFVDWPIPPGVKSVSILCVGRAGHHGGGALAWANNYDVRGKASLSVRLESGQNGSTVWDGNFRVLRAAASIGVAGAPYFIGSGVTGGGGDGGNGYAHPTGYYAGGGAGGYTGNGGNAAYNNPTAGSGGGGGGGMGLTRYQGVYKNSGGGGVGIFGQGANGGAGGGKAGSGGFDGTPLGDGGNYGGGSGKENGSKGGAGVIRIIWPGDTRLFPTTDVGET